MRSLFAPNTIVLAFSQWRKAPDSRQSADWPGEQHARPHGQNAEDHRGRIAGVLGHVVFSLVLRPSEPRAIRISTGGAPAPNLARNADTQGRLSSKLTYIGVAQQPATIRRVFVASVSLIASRRSAPRVQAMRSRRNTINSVPPSAPAKGAELVDAASRSDAAWQSSQ
jgi:hypothetical protein